MYKFIIITIICLIFILPTACAKSTPINEDSITQTKTVQASSTITPSLTPTLPPTNTMTPMSTRTPTKTPTPTITQTYTFTPTPSLSPTPFNTSGCTDMEIKISIPNDNFLDLYLAQLNSYDSRCVRLVFTPEYGYFSPISLFSVFELTDFGPRETLIITKDDSTPLNMKKPVKPSYIWGVFQAPNTLFFRRMDEFPSNQYPIKDGLYTVGSDGELAPGIWKSSSETTETNSCYWARINSQTGNIKDNHFGIAGIKVRVYEGDVFEIDGCGLWFYISP